MQLKPEYFMRKALNQAEYAFAEEEVPIGAVVVADGEIIGKGYNQVEKLSDPTAHAEMLAITAATSYLGSKYLNECTLYITVEPCVMCYGARKNAGIKHVIVGCLEPKHGFSKSIIGDKKIELITGICEDESVLLLQSFFEKRR